MVVNIVYIKAICVLLLLLIQFTSFFLDDFVNKINDYFSVAVLDAKSMFRKGQCINKA